MKVNLLKYKASVKENEETLHVVIRTYIKAKIWHFKNVENFWCEYIKEMIRLDMNGYEIDKKYLEQARTELKIIEDIAAEKKHEVNTWLNELKNK